MYKYYIDPYKKVHYSCSTKYKFPKLKIEIDEILYNGRITLEELRDYRFKMLWEEFK